MAEILPSIQFHLSEDPGNAGLSMAAFAKKRSTQRSRQLARLLDCWLWSCVARREVCLSNRKKLKMHKTFLI